MDRPPRTGPVAGNQPSVSGRAERGDRSTPPEDVDRDGVRAESTTDLVSASRELGDLSFGAFLDADSPTDVRVQWATPSGVEVVGRGEVARFEATGSERFGRIRTDVTSALADIKHDGPRVARPRAFGGFAFHDDHKPSGPWSGFEASSFVIPEVSVTRCADGTWLTVIGPDGETVDRRLDRFAERVRSLPTMRPAGSPPGIVESHRTTDRSAWIGGVERADALIEGGDLRKVVLALALSATLEEAIDVPATLERLRRQYPNCFRFMIDWPGAGTFFGAPPERLVAKRGRQVRTEALAGSAPRGARRETDDEFADRLLGSAKVKEEHGLVVEAINGQLERFAPDVSVGERRVRRLATIQHLQTPIEGTLSPDEDDSNAWTDDEADRTHVLDLVRALHPTPAVGGLPPETAERTIRAVEPFDRGWYAAPVGWFDADGDGEFAVCIRSGVADRDRVTLFAGNGIVADSDPEEEWDEVQLKFQPIMDELR